MDKEEKLYLASKYITFLIETQDCVEELYASLCYGGFVYDDIRIDLYAVFDKEPDREKLWMMDKEEVAKECSSNIGSLREYLEDRSEDFLIRDDEEPIAYIQMPADMWNALYGEADDELAEFLVEKYEEFIESNELDYDLTEYGRNAVLLYDRSER